MELLATLALLYLWQCTLAVPAGARLFVRPLRRWVEVGGGGRRTAHCWPSRAQIVANPALADSQNSGSCLAARSRFEAALATTRWLGWSCDVYALLLFAGAPLVILWLTEELGLLWSLPVLGVAHVATLLTFYFAQRQLLPAGGAERWEALFMAGLYPPMLLRGRADLLQTVMEGFHPLAIRGFLYEREQLIECLRQAAAALARRERKSAAPTEAARRERHVLENVVRECNISQDELGAPRVQLDPTSASYCAICVSDYRPGYGTCAGCGIETTAYWVESGRDEEVGSVEVSAGSDALGLAGETPSGCAEERNEKRLVKRLEGEARGAQRR
ncbi:MAG: hypothetical protein V3T33_01460 [Myxococcota bacterium]